MQDIQEGHRWTCRRLCRDHNDIPEGTGLALLWIDGDVVLPGKHGDRLAHTGDIVIADRTLLRTMAFYDGSSAQVLYFADHRILQHASHSSRSDALAFCGTTRLARTLKRLWTAGDEWSSIGTNDHRIGAAFIDLMTGLGMRMVAESTEARLPVQALDTVERARALIRTHLADPDFGVAELARRMRISTRQLSGLFAPLGTTTVRTIMEMRIARSKAMLADPVNVRRQIADIALACGFVDQNYFSRCFYRVVRQTPVAFRKTLLEQEYSASDSG